MLTLLSYFSQQVSPDMQTEVKQAYVINTVTYLSVKVTIDATLHSRCFQLYLSEVHSVMSE